MLLLVVMCAATAATMASAGPGGLQHFNEVVYRHLSGGRNGTFACEMVTSAPVESTRRGVFCSSVDGRPDVVVDFRFDDTPLGGSLPTSIGLMTALTGIGLGNTTLSGTLPSELGLLPNLQSLILHGNDIRGSLPSELGKCSQLRHLVAYRNQLEGSLPSTLTALTQLQRVLVHVNALSGAVPPLQVGARCLLTRNAAAERNVFACPLPMNLSALCYSDSGEDPCVRDAAWVNRMLMPHLSDGSADGDAGNFDACVPPDAPLATTPPPPPYLQCTSANSTNVAGLMFKNGCELSGTLPGALLRSMHDLTYVQLRDCGLRGTVPTEIGAIVNLEELNLKNNALHGTLPSELGRLRSLVAFSVRENSLLSGTLPTELNLLQLLNYFYIDQCDFSGSLPSAAANWPLFNFYVYGNQLSGRVPPVNVSRFCYLELSDTGSHNRFDCPIPPNMGTRMCTYNSLCVTKAVAITTTTTAAATTAAGPTGGARPATAILIGSMESTTATSVPGASVNGATVGGVVGGVLALVLLVVAAAATTAVFVMLRRRRGQPSPSHTSNEAAAVATAPAAPSTAVYQQIELSPRDGRSEQYDDAPASRTSQYDQPPRPPTSSTYSAPPQKRN